MSLFEFIFQCTTSEVLEHDELKRVSASSEDLDDVGMVYAHKEAVLHVELVDRHRGVFDFSFDSFDNDNFSMEMSRADNSIRAVSELFDTSELIEGELFGDLDFWCNESHREGEGMLLFPPIAYMNLDNAGYQQ